MIVTITDFDVNGEYTEMFIRPCLQAGRVTLVLGLP